MSAARLSCLILLSGLFPLRGATLTAQDLTVTQPPPRQPIYIYNATLHTVRDGVHVGGALLLRDGKIERVWTKAQDREIESDSTILIDAGGRHVYPGLISPWTAIGLSEIGSLPDTIDLNEVGDTNPELRAAVALNPDATAIPVTRVNGVLSAGIVPQGGLIPGRLSVVSLAGWTWEEMTVRGDAGLVVEWPVTYGGGRGRRGRSAPADDGPDRAQQAMTALRDLLAAGRAYARARANDPAVAIDLRLEGLAPVLTRRTPVFVRASQLGAIQQAVTWAAAEGVRLVIVGGESADGCLDLLKRHDVAVIVASTHRLPDRRDAPYDEAFTLPAQLEAAGLRWCFAHEFGGFSNERNLPYAMGTAIAYGLGREAALRAMTLSAAEILGVDDRLGSLEAGKDATLFLADGEPWLLTTNVGEVWIAGRRVEQTSKHTELARKYREKYRQLDARK